MFHSAHLQTRLTDETCLTVTSTRTIPIGVVATSTGSQEFRVDSKNRPYFLAYRSAGMEPKPIGTFSTAKVANPYRVHRGAMIARPLAARNSLRSPRLDSLALQQPENDMAHIGGARPTAEQTGLIKGFNATIS